MKARWLALHVAGGLTTFGIARFTPMHAPVAQETAAVAMPAQPPVPAATQPNPCSPEPHACPAVDPIATHRAAIGLLAQDARDHGGRLALPFIDLIDDRFHPEAVEATVDAWAADCLPDGAFVNVTCLEYPCVAGFQAPVDEDCLHSLGATIVAEVEGVARSQDSEVLFTSEPLYVGVFRDPTDPGFAGNLVPKMTHLLRSRALRPYLQGHPDWPDATYLSIKTRRRIVPFEPAP